MPSEAAMRAAKAIHDGIETASGWKPPVEWMAEIIDREMLNETSTRDHFYSGECLT